MALGLPGFAVFALTSGLIIILTAGMQRGFAEFEALDAWRRSDNERLEQSVRNRTVELEALNERLRAEATAREAAESQLRQMQKIEALSQLTGGIAHDFNNMLAVIMGCLDLAKRNLQHDTGKASAFVDHALEGAKQGANLTSRLLAFARKQPLNSTCLDLNALVGGMTGLLVRTLGETIQIETAPAKDLWLAHADESQHFECHSQFVRQCP